MRNVNDWLKGLHFPRHLALEAFMDEIQQTVVRRNLTAAANPDLGLGFDRVKKALLAYRSDLAQMKQVPDFGTFFAEQYQNLPNTLKSLAKDTFECPISFSELEGYIAKAIDYLEKFARTALSPVVSSIIIPFETELQAILRDAAILHRSGILSFEQHRRQIRERCFSAERQLVAASIENTSSPVRIRFSDDGNADAKLSAPVWYHDPSRIFIIKVLWKSINLNPRIECLRLLLLDSLKPEDYSPSQLQSLCIDIAFLMDHGVDVSIGSRQAANTVDPGLYNYALIDNGIVMRAGSQHTDWRFGALSYTHPEFQNLWRQYDQLLDFSGGRVIEFRHRQWTGTKSWKNLSSIQQKAENLIAPLQDKMADIRTDAVS